MNQRPLVAVSASHATTAKGRRVQLNDEYVQAVQQAGLVPVIVPPLEDPLGAEAIIERVSGVLLSGGRDVDPERYGQTRHASVDPPDPRRDATEMALVEAARRRGMPLLGICRGCQVMNVALGGTLIQDLPSDDRLADATQRLRHSSEDARTQRVHEISIEPDSFLATVTETTAIRANSMHHQAPDRVGAGMRVVARAPDGVIEAIECADASWWAVGVQWHPEELTGSREEWDRALFRAFADAAREFAARNDR